MRRVFWGTFEAIKMDFPTKFQAKSIGFPMGKLI